MKIDLAGAGHLQEEELVGLLDEEGSPADQVKWREHVEGCPICAEQLQELSEASGWLGEHMPYLHDRVVVDELSKARALAAVRAAARQAARKRLLVSAPVRAAAAVLVLVVGGLSVRPLGAWISERFIGENRDAAAETTAEVPAAPVQRVGAVFTFNPTGSVFRIELTEGQSTGQVMIDFAVNGQATAQILDIGGEVLTVLPAGVRVENTAPSTASYRIRLPATSTSRVQVIAGGRTLADLVVPGAPRSVVIDLADANGQR